MVVLTFKDINKSVCSIGSLEKVISFLIHLLRFDPKDLPTIPSKDVESGEESVATDGYADDPEDNVYNYIDGEDINNSGQPSGDQGSDEQQADKEGDISSPNNVQIDVSGLRNNSPYVPGALRQSDNRTDSSSCPVGYRFILATCIRLGSEELPFAAAKLTCKREGATLAMPKTKELDVALRNLVLAEGHNYSHWIGLKKKRGLRINKKLWQWVDGFPLRNYKGWIPRGPDNNVRSQLCVSYYSHLTGYPMWNDTNCQRRYRFICQAPPT
ncbi:asialoglycoprotein receptor 1-like [Branchiostoma floridae]|uniref:Asialoglycoprotein receptor 1-like n=1 Tax=Branchiostoma floridae TaxID=7739 RepID=A0A9J7N441_BRAFL|nr:asialoglycoprotein receptor 1-like [Branchiostoma floridae]